MILKILTFISETISSLPFILTIESISLLLKTVLLILVISHGLRSPKIKRPWFLLLLILIGSMLSNFAWVIYATRKLLFAMDYRIYLFFSRVAWGFTIILYQSLSLFIDSLAEKNHRSKIYQKAYLLISTILCIPWFYFALFEFNNFSHDQRPALELKLLKISSYYIFFLIIPSLIITYYKIRKTNLPKILKKQLKILISIIICPYVLSDFIQTYPFSFYASYIASNFAVIGISSTLLTYAIYYCSRRMIGLRFLNFHNHVKSLDKFNFIDDFKDVLSQLSLVTNINELGHITQTFFRDAFNIPPSRTRLYVRNFEQDTDEPSELTATQTIIENFISRHDNEDCALAAFMHKLQILIYDEIAFSNFYEETTVRTEIVQFLNQINADVFIPIYEKQTIIGYIIIERDARLHEVYSDVERDEMVVFASYLGNNIHLQQSQNIKSIIQREKEIREELYRKHQEINQYKESIRTFMRTHEYKKIGVIFYKNRKFTFGNKAASELIGINPNKQEGHVLAKSLKSLAQQVENYRSPQTCFTQDIKGAKLVLSALPSLEQNAVIITVSYPEISDIIKKQIDLLKNPSEWDYLLYLETTRSGQLINQLVPGSGEQLLNFKIELLKTALTKKALLLELQDKDLIPTVEILHHISLRENVHILKLQAPEQNFDTAIKLFGINPIFGKAATQPLLDKLDNGTLFIENIHFLDKETQEHLAEFIMYGYYHIFKSDKKVTCNTRIICSTNQNLQTLVQEGKFSKALFNLLKHTTISMPSLLTLPEEEVHELVDGFTEQAVASQPLKNLLELTDREKHKLIDRRPISLYEFKNKVQQLLEQKSKKNNFFEEEQFDPAYKITDPELIEASRLGKKALKDPKTMALLWNKFKNQNQIARFLRVNRSSVSRRCKEYNLI